MILKLDNVKIGFNKVLIDNVNLNLDPGKIVFLFARNGMGKSCFLKTIGGLVPALKGNIYFNNKNLRDLSLRDRAQYFSLLTTDKVNTEFLKVSDLIETARSPFTDWTGKLSNTDKEIIDVNISLLGLEDILNYEFSELSDGQKQKVLLCKSLSQTPKLLMLDEPTTFLDINSKVEFLKKFKEVVKIKNIGSIITTHDLTLVKEIADEIWYIDNKKINVEVPEKFFSSGTSIKLFGLDLN